ncbi:MULTISPECIES: 2-keto-4-pentenoate hydratase [Asticcacaulis]|uniref:2-keto-4-pentenoate hydratase n=1 Tax=Asticcacaulis TaxID=76890 RepID=UPI001AEA9C59|nr:MULTISPECIES: 2-keto-4-pentenoate hydratase [Asticcacaulis]MBP2160213.1 2-keto-4-pentenoate hydratase [Asticcacaulis solisilvae]MDR6801258.1 2-keto-4-pentenoate hydratase [Asticcacaulis sp. BE141]
MTFDDIANRFVTARRSATALEGYPGDIPSKLEDSYAIQERAIKLWDRPVIGWKIGRLAPEKQAEHGTERLAGPIFAPTFKDYDGAAVTLPVFTGGFAAVEAEYVFRIAHDTDPAKTEYSEEEALRLIDGLFAGIEMAGSPLATINKLGPTVVASDFGNNFGLILSERLAEFDSDSTVATLSPDAVKAYKARTEIDGQVVGEGGLFTMPGGPLKAIAWLAGHLAGRGRPLTKGQLISSGATTGIHDIAAGQTSRVIFSTEGRADIVLELKTEAASQNSRELSQ